jgi:nicotinate-nucleotide--dimethylbenzimidazole phosphoribosyltransferase
MTKSIKEITALLEILPNSDDVAKAACEQREPQLTKPAGSLGRLEEITQWLSAWQGKHPPTLDHVRARIFAGNHGVTAQGVSAFPAEVTHQMVLNFLQGGAAINQLCKTNAIELEVIALDLEKPTQDFTKSAAMTESDFVQAFEAGFQSVPAETDLLILGEMGIGNTSAAAAVAHALFGGNAADWVGSGTGVLSDGMARKVAAVEAGVQRHSGAKSLDILRCLAVESWLPWPVPSLRRESHGRRFSWTAMCVVPQWLHWKLLSKVHWIIAWWLMFLPSRGIGVCWNVWTKNRYWI